MRAFIGFYPQRKSRFACPLASGVVVLGLALAAPAANAGMGGGVGAGAAGGGAAAGAGAAGSAAGAAAGAGGGGGGGGGGNAEAAHRPNGQAESMTHPRSMVWNTKDRRRPARRSSASPGARAD